MGVLKAHMLYSLLFEIALLVISFSETQKY